MSCAYCNCDCIRRDVRQSRGACDAAADGTEGTILRADLASLQERLPVTKDIQMSIFSLIGLILWAKLIFS